jgi:hypothetical protein
VTRDAYAQRFHAWKQPLFTAFFHVVEVELVPDVEIPIKAVDEL